MSINKINITESLNSARELLQKNPETDPAIKAMFELLITIITLLTGRLSMNSRNSSKPPSSNPNLKKNNRKNTSGRKLGGQPGHSGSTLQPVDNPDNIVTLKLDRRKLPRGRYREAGFEKRQVVDIEISRVVTEYRAQMLEDSKGNRYVADFPEGVIQPIQYGQSIKSHAVYLSQFQLIPYERVADYFVHEAGIPVSAGSLFNFNREAFNRLEGFDQMARDRLSGVSVLHADETGINVSGKRFWLHNASNDRWTYFYPHEKRGSEAMDEIGILPKFTGILVHDHWKPYYTYAACQHALCNAHHLRELQWVTDNPGYKWAKAMQDLLLKINETVKADPSGKLDAKTGLAFREHYRKILEESLAGMPAAPPEPEVTGKKKRGRKKKTKEMNLLERLRDYEDDVLRFMEVREVPFTNNQGENDIRMTKVQQKISGSFRSMEGAKIFCRIRSYLLTAQKHGVKPADALKTLFEGRLPEELTALSPSRIERKASVCQHEDPHPCPSPLAKSAPGEGNRAFGQLPR